MTDKTSSLEAFPSIDPGPEGRNARARIADANSTPRKAAAIARLRARILSLERHAPLKSPAASAAEPAVRDAGLPVRPKRWELGCATADDLLPVGLETNALHEIKGVSSAAGSASAADWMAGAGFAARLASRRAAAWPRPENPPWVLWCWPKALAAEFGSPSSAGFSGLGLDPARLLIVETARSSDALNAIEECLKSGSLGVIVGLLDELDLMPARRLSLAAGQGATPCLVITHPASAVAGATATRWRIKRVASGAHRFDARAPGGARFEVTLERCRALPGSAARQPFVLEWSDEAHRFDLASVVADSPAQTRRARSGAGAPSLRAR